MFNKFSMSNIICPPRFVRYCTKKSVRNYICRVQYQWSEEMLAWRIQGIMLRRAVDREVKQGIGRRIPKDPLKNTLPEK